MTAVACRRWWVPGATVRLYIGAPDQFEHSRQRLLVEQVADSEGTTVFENIPTDVNVLGQGPGFLASGQGWWVAGQTQHGFRAIKCWGSESPNGPVGPP